MDNEYDIGMFIKLEEVKKIRSMEEDAEFMDYLRRKTSNILRDTFGIEKEIYLEGVVYREFLNEDRRREILQYRRYGLTSPQIYNLIYIFIKYDYAPKARKEQIVRILSKDVNYVKNQMQIILRCRFTPQQYQDFKEREMMRNSIKY